MKPQHKKWLVNLLFLLSASSMIYGIFAQVGDEGAKQVDLFFWVGLVVFSVAEGMRQKWKKEEQE
ncbi:MAG: hypothetical protein AAFV95_15880 [Bacteroidota bacterium]